MPFYHYLRDAQDLIFIASFTVAVFVKHKYANESNMSLLFFYNLQAAVLALSSIGKKLVSGN